MKIDELLADKKYMPKKTFLKGCLKKKDTSDMSVELDLSVFNDTLIKPKNSKTKYGFKAHAIYSTLQKRRYIISENPQTKDVYDFWDMVKIEGVGVIIAFTNENELDSKRKYVTYWPNSAERYGDITVTNYGVIDSSLVLAIVIHLELEQGYSEEKENVILYLIKGWKNGSIPNSPTDLVELYTSVSLTAGEGTVLIHSLTDSGPGAFMITYFAVIVETLEREKNVDDEDEWDGMMIIKKIKDQIPSVPLSGMEVAYIFVAIVDYFVNGNI
uniref:Tyrosine-protein phosphatase domain-containing protein n=1 Tax=Parastrongyloides trichosuri TaxID=131310 RepID=A0A0N4ZEF3_PARTI